MNDVDYGKKSSWLWFLLPIFGLLPGSVVAYFVLRRDDSWMARCCLYIGVTITACILGVLLLIGIGVYDVIHDLDYCC